jgi:PITH domain
VRGSNRFGLLPLCWIRDNLGRGEVTPRRLRIYANRANIIDFSEVDDVQPSLNISLLEGETSVTEYPLRMAAFSSINSLSLFFVRKPLIILQPHEGPSPVLTSRCVE